MRNPTTFFSFLTKTFNPKGLLILLEPFCFVLCSLFFLLVHWFILDPYLFLCFILEFSPAFGSLEELGNDISFFFLPLSGFSNYTKPDFIEAN